MPKSRTRHPTPRQALGQRGEQLAAEKLASLGCEIISCNYRCPAGEIDIVAKQSGAWIFAEVRTRRGRKFGAPEESVTARKKAHLIAAAQTYLQAQNIIDTDWRIDFIAVEFDPQGKLIRVDIIENAVNEL